MDYLHLWVSPQAALSPKTYQIQERKVGFGLQGLRCVRLERFGDQDSEFRMRGSSVAC